MRWMKHLTLAHSDAAIDAILDQFGAEAYGVWWLILEDIAGPMEPGKMIPVATHSAVKWAQICHCSVRRFNSIVKSFADLHLIDVESIYDRIKIAVPNILKYKDEYSKKSGHDPDKLPPRSDREQIQSRADQIDNTQHHLLLKDLLVREPTMDDVENLRAAIAKFSANAVMVGLLLSSLRAHAKGTLPKSFRYFLPEIEKTAETIDGIADQTAYISHLRRKWDRLRAQQPRAVRPGVRPRHDYFPRSAGRFR